MDAVACEASDDGSPTVHPAPTQEMDSEDELIAPACTVERTGGVEREPAASAPANVKVEPAEDPMAHQDSDGAATMVPQQDSASPEEATTQGDDTVSVALKHEAALHAPLLRARADPPPQVKSPAAKSTSPRAANAPPVRTGPAQCEKCVKILGQPPAPLRCFARVAEACRAVDGYHDQTFKWYHVSGHEHYCYECSEHYSRGVRAP